jgi:hypothetical protein
MKIWIRMVTVIIILGIAVSASAAVRKEIRIPDIAGYRTLKCDFHMHTVFSDGNVWPTVRVDEAWREGLDAIAITDHIEYHPHKEDIAVKHERPYDLAVSKAKDMNILLVKAAEITRDTPPGHYNALFVKDIAALDNKDFLAQIKAANDQGAFVFWNHPGWKQKADESYWFDIHTQLFNEKLVQGIEFVNGDGYFLDAHKWALERNLTFIGNSDTHSPMDPPLENNANHRTMTLVFAKDRSLDGIQEALKSGRTAIWVEDKLYGRAEFLKPLFEASVEFCPVYRRNGVTAMLEVRNKSDVPFELGRKGNAKGLILEPNSTTILRPTVNKESGKAEIIYEVKNLLIEPGKGLPITVTISAP